MPSRIEKLKVWQASMDFVIEIYNELQAFPAHENSDSPGNCNGRLYRFRAISLKEAARRNTRELLQFLYIARGSLSELDTQLEISFRLEYLAKENYERIVLKLETISKMLSGLIGSLTNRR